jgi:class 3 adenylate cyclase/pimeloyl-ACP methyl ester carboxylesterase
MKPTEPRYAVNGGVHIAYQVVGEGPVDLVYSPGIWSNLDVMWEWPAWARYLERLAAFSRLILFDMRGVGLSDRGPEPPTLERQMDDVGAVMDAVGSETAAVFGGARATAMTMLFAASHPERTRALVLYAPIARSLWAADWPFGRTEEEQQLFFDRFTAEMGTAKNLDIQGPSADASFTKWWARFERLGASPGTWLELQEVFGSLDVRRVLPHVQAPTLVLHRSEDRIVPVGQSRAIAEQIPDAKLVELEGNDHIPFLGDADAVVDEVQEFLTGARPAPAPDRVLATIMFTDIVGSTTRAAELGDADALVDEVQEFLTGARPAPAPDRVLATIMFTDIVGSTTRAAELGDERWTYLLDRHDEAVRGQLERFGGREVNTAGDGFVATFDGPGRAISCACAIRDALSALGIEVRCGLHTGEIELRGADIAGLAVHIAARVGASANTGEVLVSGAVPPLVAGSGIAFEDRGEHQLKGVPGLWRLAAVRG